ncbi:SOS response UmuD protein [Pontibacter ummariensis]|uniref:SOS response UmuD protein. Serine peptidase. MEROPS family S24 n=1 Tax=Pontibacter ummariensis TaxID=1610492 RepID=A0A239DCW8_9BACT|nr:translesion error-prone DNA polymerase V autoproteolytic subunit [Pontibacter ummariensis]PRY14336.1 SOS response UmuD protein [Pontibacter ummariensis]SNS29513.1 SOS response UmuD protein. Serine peptidase. MEROPS family S24 [Pontibacter ummariensis]
MEEAKVIPLQRASVPVFFSLELESDLSITLVGSTVKAGFPSPADDYVAGRIDLNTYITSNPTSTFLVRVEGESMIGAHIMPGDLAVVNKNRKAKSGDIVLAYVNGEFTIKRYEPRKDGAYLIAENPKYPAICVTETDNGFIWGVVEGIARTI